MPVLDATVAPLKVILKVGYAYQAPVLIAAEQLTVIEVPGDMVKLVELVVMPLTFTSLYAEVPVTLTVAFSTRLIV